MNSTSKTTSGSKPVAVKEYKGEIQISHKRALTKKEFRARQKKMFLVPKVQDPIY